jgi:hypothetical protein
MWPPPSPASRDRGDLVCWRVLDIYYLADRRQIEMSTILLTMWEVPREQPAEDGAMPWPPRRVVRSMKIAVLTARICWASFWPNAAMILLS